MIGACARRAQASHARWKTREEGLVAWWIVQRSIVTRLPSSCTCATRTHTHVNKRTRVVEKDQWHRHAPSAAAGGGQLTYTPSLPQKKSQPTTCGRCYILQRVNVSREATAAIDLHLAGAAARHGAVSEFVEAGVQVNKNQSYAQIKYPLRINSPAVEAADATAVPRRHAVLLASLHHNVTHTSIGRRSKQRKRGLAPAPHTAAAQPPACSTIPLGSHKEG